MAVEVSSFVVCVSRSGLVIFVGEEYVETTCAGVAVAPGGAIVAVVVAVVVVGLVEAEDCVDKGADISEV